MNHYCISWNIDIEAETPREAAEEALKVQRDPESMATVFEVRDKTGNITTIDLEEERGEEDAEMPGM